jgi:hypothetical protein
MDKLIKIEPEDLKELNLLSKKIGNIFDSINKKYCSDCICAPIKYRYIYEDDNGCDIDFEYPLSKKHESEYKYTFIKKELLNKTHNKCESFKSKQCGCCSKCGERNGYFNINSYFFEDKERLLYLKKKYKFTKTFGFFNNRKKCCRIPRIWRSETCLGYCCDSVGKIVFKSNNYLGTDRYKKFYKIIINMCKIKDKYNIIH